MPTNRMYHTFMRQICELRPKQRITQIRNFVWLLVGIFESRSVTLSKIAGKIPGPATLVSATRRMSRFLENPAVKVREWYRPIAQNWLQAQLRSIGEIRLILDGTKVGFGHQLLMVSMAYRKRAIPIAWTWVGHVCGHSTAHKQLALLSYVKSLLPAGAEVFVLGDCEFGSVEVLKWLEEQHWWYVLRQKADTCLWFDALNEWKPFSSFIQKAGQSFWLGAGYLTTKEIHPTHLLAHWEKGEEEPWYLATNLTDRSMTLKYYRFRAWCEEMHGDLKKHGFDLESTLLQDFEKLSRLTLAVVLLYVWLITVGGRTIREGLRHLVDRHDRRDLSIFQIGLRSVQRKLTNDLPVHIPVYSYV